MIFIDFETRSRASLLDKGAWIYSKDPSTKVLVLSYAIDHKPIKTIILPKKIPKDFQRAMKKNHIICAHNARFEYLIWNNTLKWKPLSFDKVFDTMAMCSQLNLPRSLDHVAKVLFQKSKDSIGYKLMLKMCKPRKPTKMNPNEWIEDKDSLKRLGEYCAKDVELERKIYYRLIPYWQKQETKVWKLNQEMNSVGLPIDRKNIKRAIKIVASNEKQAMINIARISKGKIKSPNQTKAIASFCGVKSISKDTLDGLLADKRLSKKQKKILKIRKDFGKSSNAKLASILNYSDTDKRIRDVTTYHGANTGRETGNGPQPLNLTRGEFKKALKTIKQLKQGATNITQDEISKSIRLLFKASKGKYFICSDYASIEARLVFWFANEIKALNDFRNKKDIYKSMASAIFNKGYNDILDKERFVGKQSVLGLGYQMGVDRFISTCKGFGIKIDRALAKKSVDTYRALYSKVPKLWNQLNQAVLKTIETGVSHSVRKLKFEIVDKCLKINLLSGRQLTYWNPKIDFDSYGRKRILYKGVNPKTKQWGTLDLYGGKILENIVQATARDLLVHSLLSLKKKGFNPVLSVYDEILCEESEKELNDLKAAMVKAPSWAKGLPLETKGWKGKRYRKD